MVELELRLRLRLRLFSLFVCTTCTIFIINKPKSKLKLRLQTKINYKTKTTPREREGKERLYGKRGHSGPAFISLPQSQDSDDAFSCWSRCRWIARPASLRILRHSSVIFMRGARLATQPVSTHAGTITYSRFMFALTLLSANSTANGHNVIQNLECLWKSVFVIIMVA